MALGTQNQWFTLTMSSFCGFKEWTKILLQVSPNSLVVQQKSAHAIVTNLNPDDAIISSH